MIETFISESHLLLRIMRTAFSLNRKEFSTVLNANYRTYNEWEKKEIMPSKKVQKNMIKIGLNPNYLLDGKSIILYGYTFEDVKETINKILKEKE